MAAAEQHDLGVDELRDRYDALGALESQAQRQLRELEAQIASCGAELEQLRVTRMEVKAQLAGAARIEMNLRPVASLRVTRRRRQAPMRQGSVETARDVIVRLDSFTEGKLAKMIGCTPERARQFIGLLEDMIEVVDDGGEQVVYRYREPDGPGVAFESQQRLRAVTSIEGVADLAAAGDGQAARNLLSSIPSKEVRRVAARAVHEGWSLVNGGGRHPMVLKREGHQPITLVSTPRDPDVAAEQLRRKIERRQRTQL
jgi:hypothetical protein